MKSESSRFGCVALNSIFARYLKIRFNTLKMQNKGIIRFFAIVFAIACLYQLSFTYVTNRVEKKAAAFGAGDAEKTQAYLDSIAPQVVYNLGFTKFTYNQVKEKEINLGLDLRGGMNVILEVSVKDIIKGISNSADEPILNAALTKADETSKKSQDAYLEIFFRELDALNSQEGNQPYSSPLLFGSKELIDKLGFNAGNEEYKNEIRSQVDGAVENVFTVLRARIDQFGVVQPNIQRLENSGRILVELPGVKDPARVQRLLQSTAQLEFWRLYEGVELLDFLDKANQKLRTIVPKPERSSLASESDEEAIESLNISSIEDAEDEAIASTDSDMPASIQDDTDSITSPDVQESEEDQFNPLFELLAPNIDFQTGRPQPGPIVGFAALKDTAKINSYLRMPQVRGMLPANYRYVKFLWSKPDRGAEFTYLLAIRGNRDNAPDLDGGVVVDARQDFDQRNRAVVNMTMNGVGAQKWQALTREASQQDPKRSVAVVLDNIVYSFPTVQGEIAGGRTEITGNFSVDEAKDLANILKAGKLPAPARIIQADVVGPSLGREAIQASLLSFLVALLLVMVYMILFYNHAGNAAVISLLTNMFFLFGILASLGAVLTLPGMAGIVLTIGMAVDANVLIFERIREEQRLGKALGQSISEGFKNSYSSIIDANVTTLLTGIILYVFGTGPIRGFATTLIIGILSSLFCAIFITRLIFEGRLEKKKLVKFARDWSADFMANTKFDFLTGRKKTYLLSTVFVLLSLVSLFTKGLNLGVDFVGGRSYQIRFDQPVNTSDLQSALGNIFSIDDEGSYLPEVKTLGSENQVIITTKYKIEETGVIVEEEIRNKVWLASKDFFASELSEDAFFNDDSEAGFGLKSSRQVGPSIASDIKTGAIWAIIFSLAVIFLYMLFRFKKLQFGIGALAALFHDVIIVMGAFSFFNGILPFTLEADQAFIAAILTVIGYSLNDTVIVFDRIREYYSHYHTKRPLLEIVNSALNGTLSRTFNTSLTTFFVLLVIFIFGGEVIRGFMFALLLGVVVGTYSSLLIATPAMYDSLGKEKDMKV
jgi:SecD/SecF fusion protein